MSQRDRNGMERHTSRSEYEQFCEQHGVAALDDEQIKGRGYSYNYASFFESEWAAMGRDRRVSFVLESARYYGLMAEAESQPKPAPDPEREVLCDCGHTVPESQVMRASLGTSCLDCYDRMSDAQH